MYSEALKSKLVQISDRYPPSRFCLYMYKQSRLAAVLGLTGFWMSITQPTELKFELTLQVLALHCIILDPQFLVIKNWLILEGCVWPIFRLRPVLFHLQGAALFWDLGFRRHFLVRNSGSWENHVVGETSQNLNRRRGVSFGGGCGRSQGPGWTSRPSSPSGPKREKNCGRSEAKEKWSGKNVRG